MLTSYQIDAWVQRYVQAWEAGDPADIAALFTPDAEYHELPDETTLIGREEIVGRSLDHQVRVEGGWDFEWHLLMIVGDTATVQGAGVHRKLGKRRTSGS